jgi:hypothetical protein
MKLSDTPTGNSENGVVVVVDSYRHNGKTAIRADIFGEVTSLLLLQMV